MRIFTAVCFTDEMKRKIIDGMNSMKNQGVIGGYTLPDNLHLTLAFIGETNRLTDIKKAVSEVSFKPFEISTAKLGSFRDIMWLGVNGERELAKISNQLRERLKEHGVNFDKKPFKAHITLVRRADVPNSFSPPNINAKMTVNKICVMKSERINGRLVYTEL